MDYAPDFAQVCATGAAGDGYQEFGRFNHHLGISQDALRVGAFLAAIRAAAARPGRKVAVDVGSGCGVLALAALRAGFEKVYCIEPSRKMAHYALHNFRRNGVADRVVMIQDGLESADLDRIEEPVDLVVTETLTSLFLGLGCWPQFEALRARLSPHGCVVPHTGSVRAVLWDKDPSSRNPQGHGLKLLRDAGVDIDLYRRTFWSVGNVFDKGALNYQLATRHADVQTLVRLDARRPVFCAPQEARFELQADGPCAGLLTWWQLQLSDTDPAAVLDSRDPRLATWHPFFIPFAEPLQLRAGDVLPVQLHTLALDAPYPYAFQLRSGTRALTEVLYW